MRGSRNDNASLLLFSWLEKQDSQPSSKKKQKKKDSAAILRKKEIFQKSSAALQDITASFTANTQSFVYMKKADFDSLLDKKTAMVLQ